MSRAIATVFGVGLAPVAPGTFGSLAALPPGLLILWLGGVPALGIATLVVTLVGWWATARATKGSDDHDPSEIVIDEVVGQWVALLPVAQGLWISLGPGWFGAVLSIALPFVLFRLFDILKPWPVSWADRKKTALGVMLDDLIAGVMAAIAYMLLLMGLMV